MTKRQLICFGIAAIIGIPTYLSTRGAIGNSTAVMLMIVVMLPLFFLAMYEKDGQPAEKILRNYIRTCILWPGIRPYKSENFYEILEMEDKPIATKKNAATKTPSGKRPASRGFPQGCEANKQK